MHLTFFLCLLSTLCPSSLYCVVVLPLPAVPDGRQARLVPLNACAGLHGLAICRLLPAQVHPGETWHRGKAAGGFRGREQGELRGIRHMQTGMAWERVRMGVVCRCGEKRQCYENGMRCWQLPIEAFMIWHKHCGFQMKTQFPGGISQLIQRGDTNTVKTRKSKEILYWQVNTVARWR